MQASQRYSKEQERMLMAQLAKIRREDTTPTREKAEPAWVAIFWKRNLQ